MKLYWKKKVLLFLLIFVIILGMTACYDHKKIILSNDVKKDVTAQEKNTIRLEKIKELPMDNLEYDPLYWKDDENFIAINSVGNFSNNYNIYNVNIKTSQVTKIDELNDAYIIGKYFWGNNPNRKLLFIRDFKLWIYDTSSGTSKIIYGLSEVKSEIEEKYSRYSIERTTDKTGRSTNISSSYPKKEGDTTFFKVEYSSDFNMGFAADFVAGSNKYVYLNSLSGLKILDIDSGKIIKLSTSNLANHMADEGSYFLGNLETVIYDKIKNTFYTSIYEGRKVTTEEKTDVYEFSLGEPDKFNKVIELMGIGFQDAEISEDGKYIYFNNSRSTGKGSTINSIIRLDTTKNTYYKLFQEKQDSGYFTVRYNYKLGLIYYEYSNENTKTGNGRMYFLGTIKDGKLKVIENLAPGETTDMTSGLADIIYNEKGDKFIFRAHFFEKDNSVKGKTYIYAVTK